MQIYFNKVISTVFKLKKKKIIVTNKKSILSKKNHNFLLLIKMVKKVNKNFNKKFIYIFFKTIIKFYFLTLKYLKLFKYSKNFDKLVYRPNFNKLKNKKILSKFPSLKKQNKAKKIKRNKMLKNIKFLVIFLFNSYLKNFLNNSKSIKLSKIYVFSNLFSFANNQLEFFLFD